MKKYAITIEATGKIVVDEAHANNEQEAIDKIKKKHRLAETRCCIVALIDQEAA